MIDDAALQFDASSLLVLNVILAVVMFSIAIDLLPRDFRALARAPKALLVGLGSQFLVLPFLTYVLVLVVAPKPSVALGLILIAACPGGNISNFITHRAGGNAALSVSLTAFATVGAIVLTPISIAFWAGLYPPTRAILKAIEIDPVSVAITISTMLILPLALGVILNVKKPDVTARLRKPLQVLSMVIFVAFVVVALAANWGFFLSFGTEIGGLVVVHNILALMAGFAVATAFGLSSFDRRAVTIETGIQNSGLGLVLVFSFFGGLGGMAVVAAFWGVWHAISGLALAKVFARREAAR